MSVSNDESAGINVDVPCRNCGEMVRKGSVRCRECGTFQDPAAEEKAASRPANLDEFDVGQSFIASENDFEIAPGVATFDAEDTPTPAPAPQMPPVAAEGDEQYALAEDPLAEDPLAENESDTPAAETPPAAQEASVDAPPAEAQQPEAAAPPAPVPQDSTGDALLDSALAEEKEALRGYYGRTVKPEDLVPGKGVVVFCPSGHKIHVADKYRGRMGRCPHCRAPFLVPGTPPREIEEEETETPEEDPNAIVRRVEKSGQYETWLSDVRLHRVQISKVRLKEGSLADESETVDLGFSEDSLLVVTVFKGKGGIGSRAAERKKPEQREKIREFLESNKKKTDPSDIPFTFSHLITKETADRAWIAQPAPPKGESMFADIPLFGTGVIAIRIPGVEENQERLYITPSLSQYRELVRLLAERLELNLPSEEHGIPLSDQVTPDTCHYTGQHLEALEHVEFYQTDPRFKLSLIGHRCTNCGSCVSEASRQQKKLGGKSGSGIAKAKCPACEQKFGDHPLYSLKPAEADTEDED